MEEEKKAQEVEEEKNIDEDEYEEVFEDSPEKGATLGNVDQEPVLDDAQPSDVKEAKAEPSDYGEDRFEDSGAQPEIVDHFAASGTQSATVKEEAPGSEPT